jgi:hypothetical protein
MELFEPPEGVPISDCFNPALVWIDVTGMSPQPQPGWTLISGTWTPPPAQTPQEQARTELATRIAQGITVTSASTPAVNGVYALDSVSTAQIFQIGLFAAQFAVFPSGQTQQAYPDASGTPHVFPVPVFVSFLRAVAPLVSDLETQAGIMAQGGTPSWPAQSAAIT